MNIAELRRLEAEPDWKIVRQKFYHSQWATAKLLEARNGGLITDEGEAWHYQYTSKDGTGGRYDMLFRRVYTRPQALAQEAKMNAREALNSAVDALEQLGFVILSRSEVEEKDQEISALRKALEMMLKEHDILSGNYNVACPVTGEMRSKNPDRWPTAAETARRALTEGKE